MLIRPILVVSTFLSIASSSYAFQQPSTSLVGASSTFSVSDKTQVPGMTLKPGSYTIHVVDQMQDRMIVQVDSTSSKDHAVFLGIPHTDLSERVGPGPLTWRAGANGTPALRGFEFAPGSTVEFVYPKAEAVDLAKRNAVKVVAVDPESEGKPVLKNMSPEDMHVIHLWMLSLTSAGPNEKTPAIAAQAYQGELAPAPVAVARSNSPTANGPKAAQQAVEIASVERFTPPAKQQPVIAKLPHTASRLPLLALLGLLSLVTAGCLRIVRSVLTVAKPVA